MKLDYSLTTAEQRVQYVKNYLSQVDVPNEKELTILADYILFVKDKNQTKKERKKEHPILTPNREVTIDKRQISYEGLVDKLENGEDGLYNLISDNNMQKLDPKSPITQKDIDTIPGIKDSLDAIAILKPQYEASTGEQKKILRLTIIDLWKQAYAAKGARQIALTNNKIRLLSSINIPEKVWFDEDMIPHSDSPLSLLNPVHIAFLLKYYQILKQESWELLQSDMRWHLIDLENVTEKALARKYPVLYDILIWKIDGLTNSEIQDKVLRTYGENHTEQYYSSVWRKRIPKLIAEQAQKDYVLWFYKNHKAGYWKRCSKCGRVRLGHSLFFARNSSKDGWYSQCKDCKNDKRKRDNDGY